MGFRLIRFCLLLHRSGSRSTALPESFLPTSRLPETTLAQLPSLGLQPPGNHFVAAREALLTHVSPQLAGIGWAFSQTLLKGGEIGIEDAFAAKGTRTFGKGSSSDELPDRCAAHVQIFRKAYYPDALPVERNNVRIAGLTPQASQSPLPFAHLYSAVALHEDEPEDQWLVGVA
jgi:hypothetical protein